MVRLITCLPFLFAFITLVSAQVDVLNTPGDVTQGAKVPITWTTKGPVTTPGKLRAVAKETQNTTVISNTVDINANSFDWVVNVTPGAYNLALNDGSGDKFSGLFNVAAAAPAAGGPPAKAAPKALAAIEASSSAAAPSNAPSNAPANAPKPNSASTISTQNLWLGLMGVSGIMMTLA